jgi:hypothetical protein
MTDQRGNRYQHDQREVADDQRPTTAREGL